MIDGRRFPRKRRQTFGRHDFAPAVSETGIFRPREISQSFDRYGKLEKILAPGETWKKIIAITFRGRWKWEVFNFSRRKASETEKKVWEDK